MMEKIEIDRNSRLYRWMQWSGFINDWDVVYGRIDSCGFIRAVFSAAVLTLVIGIVSSVIVYGTFLLLGDLCGWLIASYVFGSWIPIETYAAAGLMGLFLISLTYLCYLIITRNYVRKLTHIFTISMPSTPPVVSELYDSFKMKYCKKIKFKEEN